MIRDATDQEDLRWLLRNWRRLAESYTGKFVAVCQCQVVAMGDSWDEAYELAVGKRHAMPLVVKVDPERWARRYYFRAA